MPIRLSILPILLFFLILPLGEGAEADSIEEEISALGDEFQYAFTKILVEMELQWEKQLEEGSPEYVRELEQRIRLRMAKDKKEKEEKEERLRQLPRTDPAAYTKIKRFLGNQNFMQSPIHLTDKWFLFVQPDHTLTVIELATGKILLQDSSRRFLNILEWKTVDNRIFAIDNFKNSLEIIDNGHGALSLTRASPSEAGTFEQASSRSPLGWHFSDLAREQSQAQNRYYQRTGDFLSGADNVSEIPGNGVVWITKDASDGPAGYKLHLREDSGAGWRGTVNTVSDLLLFEQYEGGVPWGFALAGNVDVIVYATLGGKVECVERATGKSRWIYVFPTYVARYEEIAGGLRVQNIHSYAPKADYAFWGPFFSDMAAVYERELSPEGIAPFHLDKTPSPAPVPVTIDPHGQSWLRNAYWNVAVFAWGVPLLSFLALWIVRKRQETLTLVTLAVVVANSILYNKYGAFSRPTAILALAAFAAGAACFFLVKRPGPAAAFGGETVEGSRENARPE